MTTREENKAHQYRWDGNDDITSVFEYSHSLGPRGGMAFVNSSNNHDQGNSKQGNSFEDSTPQSLHFFSLTREDVQNITLLQSRNVAWTGDPPKDESYQEKLETFENEFILKIDEFLSTINSSSSTATNQKWFLKTNRHSCKDSPLDHPLESDLAIFSTELDRYPIPTIHERNIDEIDFGPAFLAMCRSRLASTAVRNGAEVLSLLQRSKRIYDDFILQLRLSPTPWDCYLAFSSYDEQMAQYPLHEFRCYISNRQIRCLMQYSYLITCPISSDLMPSAIQAIYNYLQINILPTLPHDILDLVIDLQCVPHVSQSSSLFEIKFIETNPLGPGTVWGHLCWETDRHWLLFNPEDAHNTAILPPQGQIADSQGGEKTVLWYPPPSSSSSSHSSSSPSSCPCVILYTSRHPMGMVWGGIAHIPADYLLIVWEKWNLQELQNNNPQRQEQEEEKSPSACVVN